MEAIGRLAAEERIWLNWSLGFWRFVADFLLAGLGMAVVCRDRFEFFDWVLAAAISES